MSIVNNEGHEVQLNEMQVYVRNGIRGAVAWCHDANVRAGWWTDLATGLPKERNNGELICLMHSELSEAMEADRKNLMDDKLPHRRGIEVELADCLIRIFDFAGARNLDLAGALLEKMEYNRTRVDHKIEVRKQEGGKKY